MKKNDYNWLQNWIKSHESIVITPPPPAERQRERNETKPFASTRDDYSTKPSLWKLVIEQKESSNYPAFGRKKCSRSPAELGKIYQIPTDNCGRNDRKLREGVGPFFKLSSSLNKTDSGQLIVYKCWKSFGKKLLDKRIICRVSRNHLTDYFLISKKEIHISSRNI